MNIRILLFVCLSVALPVAAQDTVPSVATPDLPGTATTGDVGAGRAPMASGCGPYGQGPGGGARMPGGGRQRADLPYGTGYEARQRGLGPGGRGYGRRR